MLAVTPASAWEGAELVPATIFEHTPYAIAMVVVVRNVERTLVNSEDIVRGPDERVSNGADMCCSITA